MSILRKLTLGLINTGGEEKKIYCKKCRTITLHISVTYADVDEMVKGRPLGKLTSLLMDYNPMNQLLNGTMFKCQECGSMRTQGALLGDQHSEDR